MAAAQHLCVICQLEPWDLVSLTRLDKRVQALCPGPERFVASPRFNLDVVGSLPDPEQRVQFLGIDPGRSNQRSTVLDIGRQLSCQACDARPWELVRGQNDGVI